MADPDNTLLIRLAGPMQSWGTSSRFQIRRTDAYPSKSGVLGMLLCAMGIKREDSSEPLRQLNALLMGLRIDRQGHTDWDYHTVGAGYGIRKAEGGIKLTASTGEPETLLSRREYLYDASFLVALQGEPESIGRCAEALDKPAWPIYLGRKTCIPAEPVKEDTGRFGNLREALESLPWRVRNPAIDGETHMPGSRLEVDAVLEHPPGSSPPTDARTVYDTARKFGYYNHAPRSVVLTRLTVTAGEPLYPQPNDRQWVNPYGPQWAQQRKERLAHDHGLCVFCKAPAVEVHHLDYEDVRVETLRSLCKLCHDACTILEYSGEVPGRVDPGCSEQRPAILEQIKRLLCERRLTRRRELLETGRRGREGR